MVIKLLIIIQFGGTALHAASLGGYTDIVERLIDFGASLDAPTEVQSHIHLSLHKLLHLHVWSRFISNQDGDTALLLACRYGHLSVSKQLIDNEANVNYQNDVNVRY